MKDYTQLSLKERQQIGTFLDMGYKVQEIAKRINRHVTTLYRELGRNRKQDGHYTAHYAHTQAQKRHHRKPKKLVVNSNGYKYVMEKLKEGWSPEQISGRMKKLSLPYRICHETIYQYIYRHAQAKIYYYLPMQRAHRKKRRMRQYQGIFRGSRSINHRPEEIENRLSIGHWEGDTIRFANERQQSITTLVERKSRFVVLRKNIRSTTNIVMGNIGDTIMKLPAKLFKTITFDQGSEFAGFDNIEHYSKCRVFYAHAHSPWLRGSNENTNKRLRRYLPKKANIRAIGQEWLDKIANQFNHTPRKCLGFSTPSEVILSSKKSAVALDSGI